MVHADAPRPIPGLLRLSSRWAMTALNGELALLHEEAATLSAENAVLEAQVGTSSENCSKPPSADGPAKPGQVVAQGPGGQAGHGVATLAQVALSD